MTLILVDQARKNIILMCSINNLTNSDFCKFFVLIACLLYPLKEQGFFYSNSLSVAELDKLCK